MVTWGISHCSTSFSQWTSRAKSNSQLSMMASTQVRSATSHSVNSENRTGRMYWLAIQMETRKLVTLSKQNLSSGAQLITLSLRCKFKCKQTARLKLAVLVWHAAVTSVCLASLMVLSRSSICRVEKREVSSPLMLKIHSVHQFILVKSLGLELTQWIASWFQVRKTDQWSCGISIGANCLKLTKQTSPLTICATTQSTTW